MEFITIKDSANVDRKVGVELDSGGIYTQVVIGFQGNSIETPVDVTATAGVALAARANRIALRIQNLGDEEVAFRWAANPVYTAGVPSAAFVVGRGSTETFYQAVDPRALHAVRGIGGTSRVLFLEWELP